MSRGAARRRIEIPLVYDSGSSGGTTALGRAATSACLSAKDFKLVSFSARFKPGSSCDLKFWSEPTTGCDVQWLLDNLTSTSRVAWAPEETISASMTHPFWFTWTPAGTGGSSWWQWTTTPV